MFDYWINYGIYKWFNCSKSWSAFIGSYDRDDVFLERTALQRILRTFDETRGVLSIQPYHEVKKAYEELSAVFNLIQLTASGAFTFRGDTVVNKRLFGPTLLVSKELYTKSGGHEAVRERVLENFFMSKMFIQNQIAIHCFGGKEAVSFRMYPNGLKELLEGWSKNFATGAVKTYIPVLVAIIVWVGGGISATIYAIEAMFSMNTTSILIWTVAYLGYVLQIYWMLYRLGTFKFFTALFYPIYLLFFLSIFFVLGLF
jgi:4,4'-diaponeurosporenoate glycosyltransferase